MRPARSRSGGLEIPSSGFPYWLFQALTTQNGAILANQDGTKVAYNDPKVVEAMQFFADLSQKHEVMPKGIIDWGTTPKDFFEGKTAMMWDHHRQPDQCSQQRQVRVWRGGAAVESTWRLAHRRRQHLHLQEQRQGEARGGGLSSPASCPCRERAADWGYRDRLRRDPARCLADRKR